MSALTQPIESFIEEQVKNGAVASEVEAEQMIVSELSKRMLDRKIASAQEQVKNGDFFEANDDFISDLLFEGRSRHNTAN